MMENKKEGYATKQFGRETKRYCQTLDLREAPELIAEYRRIHSEPYVWKEILSGIRQVGILEMEIYILGTRLFMIVDTPTDFCWDEAMGKLSTLPRQAEWEDVVSHFQLANSGSASSEKWKLMERMFYLYPSIT